MTGLPLLTLEIRLAPDASYARQQAREIAELLGFERNDQTRIATAVSEIVRNAWQYAGGGRIDLTLLPGMPQALQIEISDQGPGIADVDAVLSGNCATTTPAGGRSVYGARCVMDAFEIQTTLGVGTVVTMRKNLPRSLPPVDSETVISLLKALSERPAYSPLEELHRQNQELLQTLHQIQTQQIDWERLYREMETTNQDMLAVHDELSERNEALLQSEERYRIAYQRERHITEVLQSPLTRELLEQELPGLEVVTRYESALAEAEVGGDFFDAFPVQDGFIALAVGDASGKGLEAALRAMQVKELLRAAFALVNDTSPAPVVTRLNAYLSTSHAANDPEFNGFVTLALVVVNPQTGNGISVSAGCEPPLLLRADGSVETLHAAGIPLGIPSETPYQPLTFRLEPGETLLLVTDGVTEARRGREFLGYDGMVALARNGLSPSSLQEMGTGIVEGARAFADGTFRDDVCLLLARRTPA